MSTSQISRRYAVALFELINEGSKIEKDLANVAAVAGNVDICALLASPDYPAELKRNVIIKAAGGKVSKEIDRLVGMLVERNKACLLPEINAQVEEMIHLATNKLDAEVTVATAISKATQNKLSKALAASTGKQVRITVAEDQSILGGMIVRIGDRKIDYSLRAKLAGLRRALAS
jgi:F-type H+-transporting ATPase subunit delta